MLQLFERFRKSEKGQGMVEYGLILALVSIVTLGSLGGIGAKVSDTFDQVMDLDSVSGEPAYTDEEIDDLVSKGYIPIATADELNYLRESKEQIFGKGTKWEGEYTSGLDKKYIQVKDVNLSGNDNFEPIGKTGSVFTGAFDGGGYVISNLTIGRESEGYVGLFGRASGATFKNIGLEDVNVSGGSFVGGLVGYQISLSTVTNSYATGTVNGRSYVGGLVGYQISLSTVTNSYATGTVNGVHCTGGLVGFQSGSSTTNSYATGTVTGGDLTGGLGGLGGLVGYQENSSVSNSYATGEVNGTGRYTGGLVGSNGSSSTVTNSYATGQVSGGDYTGSLVGRQSNSSTVSNSYYDIETTGQSDTGKGEGKTTGEMKKQTTYSGWNFDTIWEITEGQYPTLR